MKEKKEIDNELNNSSSEVTELDIWFATADLYFQLEAEKQELEDIILNVRNVLDTEESEDFKLSRIDTILFDWRKSNEILKSI